MSFNIIIGIDMQRGSIFSEFCGVLYNVSYIYDVMSCLLEVGFGVIYIYIYIIFAFESVTSSAL